MTPSNSSKHDLRSRASSGPALSDYVSLWLTILAKLRRRHLRSRRDEECREFYEQFFSEKNYRQWSQDERRNVRRATISQYLTKHVPQGANLLDIGCGFGEVLSGIPDAYLLHGMDYSASNVHIAKEILKDRAEVKQGNIYEIPYETASQDVCFCLEVIEHIDDDALAIHEIVRVLKPGGILITAVPSTYYWPQYEKLIGHFRHYTRRSFEDLLRGAGLSVADYLPNYPNWHVAYSRHYCWVRFLSMTLGPLVGQRDVFRFKWPWNKETLMSKAKKSLTPMLEKDGLISYPEMDTSTFIVARKPQITDASRACGQS
jgi:ubiquinone/menaquinone biosynthesis C-methylase UbiE